MEHVFIGRLRVEPYGEREAPTTRPRDWNACASPVAYFAASARHCAISALCARSPAKFYRLCATCSASPAECSAYSAVCGADRAGLARSPAERVAIHASCYEGPAEYSADPAAHFGCPARGRGIHILALWFGLRHCPTSRHSWVRPQCHHDYGPKSCKEYREVHSRPCSDHWRYGELTSDKRRNACYRLTKDERQRCD